MAAQQVTCAECGRQFEAEQGEAEANRTPCPNCGSTARHHEEALSDPLRLQDAVTRSVDRGVNPERLAAFGLVLTVGLAVALPVVFASSLTYGLLAFVASALVCLLLLAVVVRLDPVRRKLMALMHWATRQ